MAAAPRTQRLYPPATSEQAKTGALPRRTHLAKHRPLRFRRTQPSETLVSLPNRRVLAIWIVGQRRTETLVIRRQLRTKVGVPLDPTVLAKDVRRLYRLGLFRDIQVQARQRARGIVLLVIVTERPVLRRIRFRGNKGVTSDDIKGVINLKTQQVFDRAAVQRNLQKIRELYQERGYTLATVQVETKAQTNTGLAPLWVDVVFRIEERTKLRIANVNFVGNQRFSSKLLRKQVFAGEHGIINWVFGRSLYQEALIERDVALLQRFYRDRGHVTVEIGRPIVSLDRAMKRLHVTFHIKEGPRYRYGSIQVTGVHGALKKKLKSLLSAKKGALFNVSALYLKNIEKLLYYFRNRGYAYANVNPRHKLNNKSKTVDLSLQIRRGKRVRIERIEIVGNHNTIDRVIRREIMITPGDLYHLARIRMSQQRLFALGFFEKNDPRFGVKVVEGQGTRPDRRILRFLLKEKASGKIMAGLSYSNRGPAIVGQFAKQNFRGKGQTIGVNANLSWESQEASVSFQEPSIADSRFSYGFSAYYTHSNLQSLLSLGYRQHRMGGSLTGGMRLFRNLSLLMTYRLEKLVFHPMTSVSATQLRLGRLFTGYRDPAWSSSIQLSLQWDQRDNRISPTSGHFHRLSVNHADESFLSLNRSTSLDWNSRFYVSLPFHSVFRVNAQASWVGSSNPRGVPMPQLYRMGGIFTVRGYPDLSIGPRRALPNQNGAAHGFDAFTFGGNKRVLVNAELEIPIVRKMGIKGVAFFDAGNVFGRDASFFQDKENPGLPLGLLMAAGVGVRWLSPMGLIRLELGVPLTPRPGDPGYRVHVSFGGTF